MESTTPTIEALAARYRCHRRTVERMRTDGVDIYDPAAVGLHLASRRSANLPALERVHALLEELGPVARIEH